MFLVLTLKFMVPSLSVKCCMSWWNAYGPRDIVPVAIIYGTFDKVRATESKG